ncbi:MAG: DUF4412 domain-containing protein [Blastocatellia bacterium]|nr:DUF4412 domain-containing protein [Blastocatellia bacterium]HMW01192.1 DUF4412 domain-containing protein [Acidobacteriota bacterium]
MKGQQSRKEYGWRWIVCVMAAITLSGCQPGKLDLASIPRTFSATMHVNGNSEEIKISEIKIAKQEKNVRAEVSAAGRKQVSIMNVDKKKLYLVSEDLKSYMEAPLDEKTVTQNDPFQRLLEQPGLQIEELGNETVDGHPCRKVKATVMKDGKQQVSYLWCATDLKNFPIKIEEETSGKKLTITFTELKFDVAAALFEPPTDYKQITVPAGVTGPAPRPNAPAQP